MELICNTCIVRAMCQVFCDELVDRVRDHFSGTKFQFHNHIYSISYWLRRSFIEKNTPIYIKKTNDRYSIRKKPLEGYDIRIENGEIYEKPMS